MFLLYGHLIILHLYTQRRIGGIWIPSVGTLKAIISEESAERTTPQIAI